MSSNTNIKEIIKRINNIKSNQRKLKNIFKIFEFIFKKTSNQLNKKADNMQHELHKYKKRLEIINIKINIIINYLENIIKNLKEEDESGSGASGNSGQLLTNDYDKIKELKKLKSKLELMIEKQKQEISTYKDLAEITNILSELCKLTADGIDKVEEMETILEIIFEVISLIHPLLQQLKINFKITVNEVEIEFGKNFNDFAIEVIDIAGNNLNDELVINIVSNKKNKINRKNINANNVKI